MQGSATRQFADIFTGKPKDSKVESLPGVRQDDASADPDAADDLGSFGWLRGMRERAVTLTVWKKTEKAIAVDYGGLKMEFDPSEITLTALCGVKIRIKGRNLNAEVQTNKRLFQGLTLHRVPWIVEADKAKCLEAGRDDMVIESVEW